MRRGRRQRRRRGVIVVIIVIRRGQHIVVVRGRFDVVVHGGLVELVTSVIVIVGRLFVGLVEHGFFVELGVVGVIVVGVIVVGVIVVGVIVVGVIVGFIVVVVERRRVIEQFFVELGRADLADGGRGSAAYVRDSVGPIAVVLGR